MDFTTDVGRILTTECSEGAEGFYHRKGHKGKAWLADYIRRRVWIGSGSRRQPMTTLQMRGASRRDWACMT